ncbi:hypothetical protein DLM45_08440 [Hyphomicrobium methylovorum]|uniref:DNA-3-methyladenine glycosylase family protein n=1 Tax=Hyphomicrobium methylovorum TaxID=84 RepID=UPI0015E72630|nr:DNA-3-methyladenine glycosylase 2 family protein [Hyphomicrobium methylovorum]MBA2126250.1 hypothetical protein [Hyphomicrobium methylovorum]
MALILERTGLPPQRKFPLGFAGLSRIIIGQQLSIQSAAAIWSRFESSLLPLQPETLLARTDADFQGIGLSAGKLRTLRALSRAIVDDGLDLVSLDNADDATIVSRLTSVHGIGPWTADIYLMFALARRDAFACGDLALQLVVQHHLRLKSRPTTKDMERIAERWRPARAVAAHLLWADYAHARTALLKKTKDSPFTRAPKPRAEP